MLPTTPHIDPATGLPDGRALLAALDENDGVRRTVELIAGFGCDGLDAPLMLLEDPRIPRRVGVALTNVAGLRDGCAYRFDGGLFAIVAPSANTIAPLAPVAQVALEEISPQLGRWIRYAQAEVPPGGGHGRAALRIAFARLRVRLSWTPQSPGRQARDVLLQLLAERRLAVSGVDRARLAADAVATGRTLGLLSDQLDMLVRAAELQDVGMLSLPESLLLKRDSLTAGDWELVQRHPIAGQRVLAAAPALTGVARIVRSCYERYDGTGYPDGLAGDDIPLAARIISVCVAYHAMTAPRAYRPPRSAEAATAELRACAGTQFDPLVVDVFGALTEGADTMPLARAA